MILKIISTISMIVSLFISVFGVFFIFGFLSEIRRDIRSIEDKLYDIEKWLVDRE